MYKSVCAHVGWSMRGTEHEIPRPGHGRHEMGGRLPKCQ